MEEKAPPAPYDPRAPDAGESNFVAIAGALGGLVLVLGILILMVVQSGTTIELPTVAASKNRWPSKKDLGLSDKPYTPKNRRKSDHPPVRRTGTPFGDNSTSFLITTPSFGTLKTRYDWEEKESELLSEGTPKALWQLAHLFAHSRNPYQNYGTAISYLQDSLAAGAGVAAYDLARAYDRGLWEIEEDKGEAKRYFRIALEHGITNARASIERLEKEGY